VPRVLLAAAVERERVLGKPLREELPTAQRSPPDPDCAEQNPRPRNAGERLAIDDLRDLVSGDAGRSDRGAGKRPASVAMGGSGVERDYERDEDLEGRPVADREGLDRRRGDDDHDDHERKAPPPSERNDCRGDDEADGPARPPAHLGRRVARELVRG